MDAMDYEFLVRAAYDCGRSGSPGADADIYRSMELALALLDEPKISTKSVNELDLEYRYAAAKVRRYTVDAINKGISRIYDTADRQALEQLAAKLHVREFRKDVIDKVIDEASEIFSKHHIEPG
jgi:hypothetical protein